MADQTELAAFLLRPLGDVHEHGDAGRIDERSVRVDDQAMRLMVEHVEQQSLSLAGVEEIKAAFHGYKGVLPVPADSCANCADRTRRKRSGQHSWRNCRLVRDRKSTRLNSSHLGISYAVFCLNTKRETAQT